jgi:cell division septation protein DedD
MRELDQPRERNDETAGRKLGLFALAGILGVAAIIAFGVVAGGSPEREQLAELDPLSQLALAGADPKAPATLSSATDPSALGSRAEPRAGTPGELRAGGGRQPTSVQLDRLSFPATLVGDESAIEATVRAAEAEHASIVGRPRTHASDIPAVAMAGGASERLSRAAKHDPLVAQAMPERGGAVVPSGSEGAFTLQVVSYDARDIAERFATALRARGHRAFVTQAELPGRGRSYRVRVGPFTTRRDALAYQASFEREERMHSVLVTGTAR